jgi:hypothetical protein
MGAMLENFKIIRCFLVSMLFLIGLFVNCGQSINAADARQLVKPLILESHPRLPVEIFADSPRLAVARFEGDGSWAMARKTVIISTATGTISNPQLAMVTPSSTPEEQDRATIRLIYLLVGGLIVLTVVMIVVVVMVMKKLKKLT